MKHSRFSGNFDGMPHSNAQYNVFAVLNQPKSVHREFYTSIELSQKY